MEIRQIYYVLEVAKQRSFSKAAEALFVSPPAISQQIHALEEELSVKLFKRDTHSVVLSAEGEKFCAYAKEVIGSVNKLLAAFGQSTADNKTTIRIGVFPFYKAAGLVPIINDFFIERQNVIGSIKVVENYEAYEMLEAGRLDFVIIKARIENANRPGIRYEVLRTERLNVLISRANPLAREENMQVENLSRVPLLTGESDSHFFNEMKEMYRRYGVDFNVAFMNTAETDIMLDMVQAGTGILLITDTVAKSYENEMLAALPIEPPQEILTFLAWKKSWRPSGAYTAFKNYVIERFNKEKAGSM